MLESMYLRMMSMMVYVVKKLQSIAIFFLKATTTTEIYTLSLHDALPISVVAIASRQDPRRTTSFVGRLPRNETAVVERNRSEEHTSELQSHVNLVCRLLLEKKKT